MTKDEIKQSVSMRSVVERYGIPINRSGFCRCTFHSEKTASMKIYKDSFHCFGCGKSGDVFTFVQNAENCDFKTAFQILGGNYQPKDAMANLRRYRSEKDKETRNLKQEKLKKQIKEIYRDLQFYIEGSKTLEPFSDEWCFCVSNIEPLRYQAEVLDKEWEDINNGITNRL